MPVSRRSGFDGLGVDIASVLWDSHPVSWDGSGPALPVISPWLVPKLAAARDSCSPPPVMIWSVWSDVRR